MSDTHDICIEIGECATDCPEYQPQTWQLPPEPGPEVKAVRGRALLIRNERFPRYWWVAPGSNPMITWLAALRDYGPTLTDATHELEEE